MIIKKYADLSGPYLFYGGTERLWFTKEKWLWLRETAEGLVPLSGVTKIVKISVDKSTPLMIWAVRKNNEKLRALLQPNLRSDGFYEVDSADFEGMIDSSRKADREVLDDAAEVGHQAHEWIENVIKSVLSGDRNRMLELLAKLPEEERAANCCIAAIDWMVRHSVRWVATERKVFSRKYGYAGTMDGLCYCSSCDDAFCCPEPFENVLSIADWKSSNQLNLEYLLQVAAYWAAFVEETGELVQDRWINRLGKVDGEFDPWHLRGPKLFEEDFAAFLHALNLTRAMDDVEDRIGEIKERRRAAMKLKALEIKMAAMAISCPKAKEYQGVRKSKCLPDGSQCQACSAIYTDRRKKKGETPDEKPSTIDPVLGGAEVPATIYVSEEQSRKNDGAHDSSAG